MTVAALLAYLRTVRPEAQVLGWNDQECAWKPARYAVIDYGSAFLIGTPQHFEDSRENAIKPEIEALGEQCRSSSHS